MNQPEEVGNSCIILVEDLFAKINKQRKLLNRTPIENQAIASRCTLRFNVDKQRGVDFSGEIVLIAPGDVPLLEKIVTELFDVYFEGEVRKLCARPKAPVPKPADIESIPPLTPDIPTEPEKPGLLSRLMGLITRR